MWSMPVAKKLSDGRENPENTEVPGSVDFTKPFLAWWVSCHRPLCGVYFSFGSLVMRGQGPALWKSPKNQSFFFVLTSLSASFVEIFIYIIGVLIGRSDLSVSSNPWCLPRNFEEIQSALVTTQEAKTVSLFFLFGSPLKGLVEQKLPNLARAFNGRTSSGSVLEVGII